MPDNKELKQAIQSALSAFEKKPLADAALDLLGTLGYRSERRLRLMPNSAKQFQAEFDANSRLNADAALVSDWKSVDLLIQITDNEIREAIKGTKDMFASKKLDDKDIRSYLFFAVELKGKQYTRTQLAGITREINKLFPMPVMVVFRYDEVVSLAIIARRINKRDGSKDVLEKVTLIKDIRFTGNRAQIEILHDLAITQLMQDYAISNFVDLQHAWEKTLDLNELNKKFYKEIANWYFWAVKTVKFPNPLPTSPKIQRADFRGGDEAERNAQNVIRLITRLIFVWFIKEKGLVPEELFEKRWLDGALKYEDPKKSTYYKAILQNLFFATLNTEMDSPREFRRENAKGQDPDYLMSNFYRYKRYFKNHEEALKIFAGIPFLNGGLFECLDKEIEKGKVIRVDGFSDRDDNPLTVPDDLFLMEKEKEIDLNEVYDTKNKKYKVRGLIHIFNSYKFTIEENTPIEEEIALDPELLGKVFENLLAAYNPETGTTARKQTGSFYTPREIVNYMVDEALIAYLESALTESGLTVDGGQLTAEKTVNHQPTTANEKLRDLLSYNQSPHAFTQAEVSRLIAAIDNVKVLDPAAGSGAFPMGVLHKLVFLLAKLDPQNEGWQRKQISKANEIQDSAAREAAVRSIAEVFTDNHNDYGRKLFLIENCIYGVDIQPIAVQIAKLRFFISLVVDQKTNAAKPNLGIRPLPNLETKFVAANTLIGIQRPDSRQEESAPASTSPEVDAACEGLIRKLEQYLKSRNENLRAQYIREAQEFADVIHAGMGADFQPLGIDWIFTTAKDTAALKALLPVKREAKASPMVLRNQQIEEKEKELERVRREHFSARTPATKRKYRDLDKKLRLEIADLLSKNHALGDETAQQLAGWDPYNQNAHADFFDPEWMFGVEGGFDVVIGNPPYIRQEQIKEIKPTLQEQFSCYMGTADLYVYFYERGLRLLRNNGALIYISSNKYLRAGYGEKLRAYIATNTSILQLIDFGDTSVFTAIAYPSIILVKNTRPVQNKLQTISWDHNAPLDVFEETFKENSFLLPQESLGSDGWRLEFPAILNVLDKVKNTGKPLHELVEERFYRGVTTGLNEAVVVDRPTYEKLISDHKSSHQVLKPFLRGRDVKRWNIDYSDLYLIKIESSENKKHPWTGKPEREAEKIFSITYPAIYKHLQQFRDGLIARDDQGKYYWELRSCVFWDEFEKPKIVYPDIAQRSEFSYDPDGRYYLGNTMYLIPTEKKWLLGVLNSNLIYWYYKKISSQIQSGYVRFIAQYVAQIPVVTPDNPKQLESLITKILAAKRADPQADTSPLEGEIDQLVYQLYGLTEDEVKIVEGK